MASYTATINVVATPEQAFAYLRDPMNRVEWDPSVRRVVAAGDHFDVTVGFYGKAIDATYTVSFDPADELDPPSRIVFETAGKVKGRDVIEIVERDGGSSITLDLEVLMKGPARLLDRGLQVAFAGIGDNMASEMKKRLDGAP
ncbi:MAG: SRPBCC family protein [Acidimicrobiales bacterium]